MPVINETLELSKWIYAKLSGDATILSEVDEHPVTGIPQIYEGFAPQEATGKYIVFKNVRPGHVRKSDSGRNKIFVRCLISILVWNTSEDFTTLEVCANKIEELFKVDHLNDDDAIVGGCCSRQQVNGSDRLDDGIRYIYAGSYIEFFVHGVN